MSHQRSHPDESVLLHRGDFLELREAGTWEYVARPGVKGIVAIVAITDDRRLILVEQYRPPLGKFVIELPAGLAGDIPLQEDEPLVSAARRELSEETGYTAKRWTCLGETPTSAGLTTEVITFFHAGGLVRVGEGGGDHHEDIRVHLVPLADLRPWSQDREREGKLIDFKIYAGLYLARAMGQEC